MESDTTVPGDGLRDPVETPAGNGEPAPVFSVTVVTVNEAISNPVFLPHRRIRVQLVF